jgi:hypothetical protein
MPRRLRAHLTYANVMSTLAVFLALGGSAYAVATITGRDVKDRSLTGADLKRNSIGAKPIKQRNLKAVANARRLNGRTANQLLIKCPDGTFPAGGTCIEGAARPPLGYGQAVLACASADGDKTAGRRLPIYSELVAGFSRVDPAPGGELTGHIYPVSGGGEQVLVVTDKPGNTAVIPNDADSSRAFRCAIDPLN